MKLKPQQLHATLSSGLAPVYVVCGEEPLLVDEVLDVLRAAAVEQDYAERQSHVAERGFDWEALGSGMQNMSLFAQRRLIELRLPTGKPGDKGGKFLTGLTAHPADDTVFVIILPGLESRSRKTKWAQTLAKEAVWLDLRAPDHAELPDWIAGRLQRANLRAEPDAIEFLASQVEGNLLAAKQEIDQLTLLAENGQVTLETVRASVANGARYDVFQLSEAALAGDVNRATRILSGLEREGVAAPLVLWSLAREISTVADVVFLLAGGAPAAKAMADAGVWRNRQQAIGRATRQRSPAAARALLRRAARADRIVKGKVPGQPWNALLELTLSLAGHYRLVAETA